MAVVGDAYVVVRAITNRVKPDIERAFSGLDRIGERQGSNIGNSFSRGIRGSVKGNFFSKKFEDEAEAARKAFQRLVQVGYFVAPAISGIVGAIGALGGGLVTLVTILSRATPAAIALVGALQAVGQAALVASLAFGGVGKAIGASDKATGSAVANARALERANKRLADAKKALEDFEADIFDRNLQRRRQLQDAEDAYADAQISLIRSQRAANRATDRAIDAQEAVTKAREDAREAIQQLRFELEGGAISEKKARLEFEKARESLQRVQDLPPNSRARQEAELAFAEAELNLRKAIDRNQDLQKEEAAASKAGVEGSKAVQDAKKAAADALIAEEDALVDLAQEQRDFDKLTMDTVKAREELSKATFDAQIKEERKELKDAIKEAKKDLEDLKKSSGGAPSALQQALKDLSPEARDFVMFIRDEFKPALQELRAEAGKEFFPKLETALRTIKDDLFEPLKPLIRDTGGVLGDVAIEIANVVTETENVERLERVWKTGDKLIGNFGGALGNIYELLLILLDAGRPVIEEFGQWIEDLTGGWANDAAGNFDTIRERMVEAGEIVKRIAGIFGTLFDAFGSIGESIVNGGALDSLLTYFEESATKFAELMESMNQDGSLGEYFLKATENAQAVLSLLANIVAEVLKLGDDEGVGVFVNKLSEAVDIFGEIGTEVNKALPAFGDFIIAFAELIANLTESGSLETFFGILTDAVKVVNKIFGNETVKQIFLFVAPIFAASRAFGLLFRVASFGFKVLFGNFNFLFGAGKKGFSFLKGLPDKFTTLRLKGMYAMDAIRSGATKVKDAAITMGQKVGGALKTAGTGIKAGATKGFSALKTGFSTLGTAAATAGTAIKGALTKIVGAVKGALMTIGRLLLANPWILIVVAIVAVVTLIIMNWDKIKEYIGAALDWIGEKISAVWNWIVETTTNIWNGIVDFFTTFPGKILDALAALATTVLEFLAEYHPIAIIWRLITENWETISTFFTELPGKILDFIKGLGSTVLEFINKYHPILVIWRLISENWDTIKTWFTNLPGRIKTAIFGLSTTVWNFIKQYNPITLLINKVKEVWPTLSSWLGEKMDAIVDFVKGLPQKIKDAASGMWDGIKDAFKNAINWIIDGWNGIEFKIPGFKIGPIGYDGFTLGLPDIPRLAKGGVVNPSYEGSVVRVAEAGRPERIEPLDENGLSKRDKAIITALTMNNPSGSGTTINVYPSEGMNERELAQKVSRELALMMRRGAA